MTALLPLLLAGCQGLFYQDVEEDGSATSPPGASGDEQVAVDTGWPDWEVDGEDFAWFDRETSQINVHWNSAGSIESQTGTTWSVPVGTSTVLLCDYDGDGYDDVWAFSANAQDDYQIDIYTNEAGVLSSSPAFTHAVSQKPDNMSPFCGDFRGTGQADVVLFKQDMARMLAYANEDGTFDWDNPVRTDTELAADSRWVTGDFDSSGTEEVGVWSGTSFTAYPMTELVFESSTPVASAAVAEDYKVTSFDLDDDGYDDLALWNGGALVVYPGTGSSFDTKTLSAFTVSGNGTALGGNLR